MTDTALSWVLCFSVHFSSNSLFLYLYQLILENQNGALDLFFWPAVYPLTATQWYRSPASSTYWFRSKFDWPPPGLVPLLIDWIAKKPWSDGSTKPTNQGQIFCVTFFSGLSPFWLSKRALRNWSSGFFGETRKAWVQTRLTADYLWKYLWNKPQFLRNKKSRYPLIL